MSGPEFTLFPSFNFCVAGSNFWVAATSRFLKQVTWPCSWWLFIRKILADSIRIGNQVLDWIFHLDARNQWRFIELWKANQNCQPCLFYITGHTLKMPASLVYTKKVQLEKKKEKKEHQRQRNKYAKAEKARLLHEEACRMPIKEVDDEDPAEELPTGPMESLSWPPQAKDPQNKQKTKTKKRTEFLF